MKRRLSHLTRRPQKAYSELPIEAASKAALNSGSQPDLEPYDPVLASFLALLAKDIEERPQELKQLSPALFARIKDLVSEVNVDPTESLGSEPLL